jgi:hypothetical protein
MRMPTLSYEQEPEEEPTGSVSPAMGPLDPETDESERDH